MAKSVDNNAQLSDLISQVQNLSAPSTTKFDGVAAWLAQLLGLDPDDVGIWYVSKPANFSVRLSQPGAQRDHAFGVALVSRPDDVGAAEAMAPSYAGPGRPLRTLAVVAPSGDGHRLSAVVAEDGDTLADAVTEAFPGSVRLDPSAPVRSEGRASPVSVRKEEPAAADATVPLDVSLKEALVLQSEYSSAATPAMVRRGEVVRRDVPDRLRLLLSDGLLPEGWGVVGSDGIGRKSLVPWVRIFDPVHSPRTTEGWYAVFLFAASGDVVYLSLNQGTRDTTSSGGWRKRPENELAARVAAARQLLGGATADPRLVGELSLGTGELAQSYEVANVCAYAYSIDDLPSEDQIVDDLRFMIESVSVLYNDETPAQVESDLTFQDLSTRSGWSEARLNALFEAALEGQVVLAGPPGTGKTWLALELARLLTGDRPEAVTTVQLHPSYGYEEFVEGLRPVANSDGGIEFAVVDGVVKRVVAAIEDPEQIYVIVLDEMNRANLPRVLGELMLLLEYRDTAIDLQYSTGFELPSNLVFLGTMNTADRSIRSIDIALRRRFQIFECWPDPQVLASFYELPTNVNEVPELTSGFKKLNGDMEEWLDRHHTIGQTFFMRERLTMDHLAAIWERQLMPLIDEYFFDQPELAEQVQFEDYWGSA